MSGNGGDNAHNNQFGGGSRGPTGGVNGTSSSGGPNSGNGWTTTTDPGGWSVHHYTGDDSRTGSQGNGGGNSSNLENENSEADPGSISINLSLFPEAQASVAAGMSINISVIDGLWGFTFLKSKTVTSAIETALSRLTGLVAEAAPLAGRFAGVVVGSLLPTPIARDDPTYMGPIQDRILQALLATKVTDIAPESLPLSGTVPVKIRIRDIVSDEKQHIAVVRPGVTQPAEQVQVVQAVATSRKDVYQVPLAKGMPPIHIHLSAQTQQAVSQASGVISEIKNNSPAKVTPAGGNNTRDAIVRFPAEAQQEPIYISIIDVIPAVAQKQLNEQAMKQQTVWGLESLLSQLNATFPRILSTDYKLLDFTDEENVLLRRNNYAAQLAQIKLFEITQTRASAELLEAEAAVTSVKGEPDKATFLLQRSTELRSSIPAMETQLSALNKEAVKIHAQYEIMYKTATERFFRQRAEDNQRAVEAYHQQQKEERENYLRDAMAAANIKSAEQLKQEIEATLQEITIPSIDRKRLEIIDFLNPIIPEASVPKPEIAIPSFNFPAPPNFMPQKSLAERQEWAQFQLSILGTVALRGFSSSEPTSRSPLSFAGHKTGSVTFAGEGAASLWRQAAEARQILQQTSHPLPAAAMLTAISTVDSDISTIMLAVEVLGLSSEKALMHANDTAELSLTAQLVQLENQLGIALVRHPQSVAVPVVNMSMWPDTATGFYRYELADDAGVRVTVLITPDKAPGTEPLSP